MTTLTKQDLKCLKNADSICFDFNNDRGQLTSQIRCNKDASHSNDGFSQTHYIECDSKFEIYLDNLDGKYQSITTKKPSHCFGYISTPIYEEEWQTTLSLLKENDTLVFKWQSSSEGYIGNAKTTIKGDNGGYIAFEERLYYDKLFLTVIRENGKKLSFHIATSICPNNSARMIQGL